MDKMPAYQNIIFAMDAPLIITPAFHFFPTLAGDIHSVYLMS